MKLLKPRLLMYVFAALASSAGLLNLLWDWLGPDITLAIGGIGIVCVVRGAAGLFRSSE